MDVTAEMYTTLFNGISDAREKLMEGIRMLDEIQLKAEEIYILKGEKK